MEWNDSLLTGVEKIDNQHKELFRRVNNVLEACNQRKGKEIVGETLNFLESYVEEHFRDEEKLQLESQYPGYEGHKLLHAKFIKDIKDLKSRFERDGASILVVIEMNKTIVGWLREHIMKVDKKFAEYYTSR
ncbi:MAG: hemerythrin [Epulopiscium sp.]|jgi:hemerythrin|uniref:Bacteriohemerythrin n=1 Tax=Defluviitalea raffinosedens TaxID=1450156 RepID=A0A7C8LEQ1_9FIRM|nr:bacteriohemerythrin [Defluviitalea raffinosedens]MBZ4668264.1 hemerythrin-like metal-binding protein [Defluviitaleaceae bacterium]MDK2787080.1 hemerythrin [Candidatus Epulonipiscium sp.]KAE9634419.1 bacteriohemerythrin [Defluviitalea raffinosedens]MBM7684788.1 hemerythrin [Defluviitalea raffinosedens]HHW67024.1 hemerythrin family protein [Candidatus Epulonipiscium sp.]